jgi:Bax protein
LSEHKQRFIQTLLPLIQHENNKILAVRANLLLMTRKASFVEFDRAVLARLSKEYRVPEDAMGERKLLDALLMRVDVLPADLVLAQAAMESAWGTSRFATEGNNYFGQWCFKKGCGLVPEKRKKKKRHEVRRFASPAESVRAYMRNINSHSAYAALRELRYRHKINKQAVSGEELAYGLESYSIMGESYVLAIRDIIQSNGLNRLAVAI